METLYAIFKALHIVAIIVFVAGLLVQSLAIRMRAAQMALPAGTTPGDAITPIARWWDSRVTVAALVIAWLLGLHLAQASHRLAEPWVIGKFAILLGLSGLHGMQSGLLKRGVASPELPKIAANSAPIVIVFVTIAVVLAVLKPH